MMAASGMPLLMMGRLSNHLLFGRQEIRTKGGRVVVASRGQSKGERRKNSLLWVSTDKRKGEPIVSPPKEKKLGSQ